MINYLPAFRDFLRTQKFAAKTVRNYSSDVNQFLVWVDKDDPCQIDLNHFSHYLNYLNSLNIPRSTISRHLASLRQFAQFLNLDISLDNPPLPLIPTLLKNFRAHLTKSRYKHKTIANYLSDIKHYLEWAETQL